MSQTRPIIAAMKRVWLSGPQALAVERCPKKSA